MSRLLGCNTIEKIKDNMESKYCMLCLLFSYDSLDPQSLGAFSRTSTRSPRIKAIVSKATQSHSYSILFQWQFAVIAGLNILFIDPAQIDRETFEFRSSLSHHCRLGHPRLRPSSNIDHSDLYTLSSFITMAIIMAGWLHQRIIAVYIYLV